MKSCVRQNSKCPPSGEARTVQTRRVHPRHWRAALWGSTNTRTVTEFNPSQAWASDHWEEFRKSLGSRAIAAC